MLRFRVYYFDSSIIDDTTLIQCRKCRKKWNTWISKFVISELIDRSLNSWNNSCKSQFFSSVNWKFREEKIANQTVNNQLNLSKYKRSHFRFVSPNIFISFVKMNLENQLNFACLFYTLWLSFHCRILTCFSSYSYEI